MISTKVCTHSHKVYIPQVALCLQNAQHQAHEVLHNSVAEGKDDSKSYYATVADAVTSAGTAIGQLSSQMFGGTEVRRLIWIASVILLNGSV